MVLNLWRAFNSEQKEQFCLHLCALWYLRNMLIFEGKDLTPHDAQIVPTKTLMDYKAANEVEQKTQEAITTRDGPPF